MFIQIILILLVLTNKSFQSIGNDCIILNRQYLSESLYVFNSSDTKIQNVFLHPFNKLNEDFTPIRWLIQQVNHEEKETESNETLVYLRNNQTNQYLCATSRTIADISKIRLLNLMLKHRVLSAKNINYHSLHLHDECKWRLIKNGGNNLYQIWNMRYDEPMYSANSVKSSGKNFRHVFTWTYHVIPKTANFKWRITCINN